MSRLVISRREKESFFIFVGDKEIEVFVSKISGNQVSIAVDADRDVEVVRTELTEIIEDDEE